MGDVTTTRLTGRNGKVFCGSAAGTSDVYAAAGMKNADLTIQVNEAEATACDDDYEVATPTTGRATVNVGKFVDATPDFCAAVKAAIDSKEALYLSFQTSEGEVLAGLFIPRNVRINLAAKEMVMENGEFASSGAFTFGTASGVS